jgi:hypothetical protein
MIRRAGVRTGAMSSSAATGGGREGPPPEVMAGGSAASVGGRGGTAARDKQASEPGQLRAGKAGGGRTGERDQRWLPYVGRCSARGSAGRSGAAGGGGRLRGRPVRGLLRCGDLVRHCRRRVSARRSTALS